MNSCEIYFEMHWKSIVKLILSVEELLRESFCESIEPLFRGVDDVFRLEHSVDNAKLREMS